VPLHTNAGCAALIIVSVLFAGCSLFPHDSDYEYYTMYPQEVAAADHGGIGDDISFEIESAFNSSCGEYSHAEIRRSNFDLFVKFYQRRKRETVCATVMVPTRIRWRYNPVTAGEYRFHFWRSDSTSLDTTILVR
jgi:hypothetical protein